MTISLPKSKLQQALQTDDFTLDIVQRTNAALAMLYVLQSPESWRPEPASKGFQTVAERFESIAKELRAYGLNLEGGK